jgi:hypothetical protein
MIGGSYFSNYLPLDAAVHLAYNSKTSRPFQVGPLVNRFFFQLTFQTVSDDVDGRVTLRAKKYRDRSADASRLVGSYFPPVIRIDFPIFHRIAGGLS